MPIGYENNAAMHFNTAIYKRANEFFGGESMKDDYGYFGSGLEGYVHYMEAYKQIFENKPAQESICGDDSSGIEPEDDEIFEDDSDMDFSGDDSSDSEDF